MIGLSTAATYKVKGFTISVYKIRMLDAYVHYLLCYTLYMYRVRPVVT